MLATTAKQVGNGHWDALRKCITAWQRRWHQGAIAGRTGRMENNSVQTTSKSMLETRVIRQGRELTRAALGWNQFIKAMFSFPAMCVSLMVAVLFALSVRAIGEPDIWWHLRNARQLLEYRAMARVDTYSFTANGAPWINHEWLSEVPFFLGFKSLGLQGILLTYFVLVALIYLGVYYRAWRGGANCKNAVVATMVSILFGVVSIGPRMLLFGWLCMVVLLILLDRFRRKGSGIWLVPPLFALWINLHGSWVFGLVVLATVILCGLPQGTWGLVETRRWAPSERRKLLTASALSCAALLLNPFGYHLILYPLELLSRQHLVTSEIQEWQPVNFATGNGKLALIMILTLLAAALFSRRKWRLDEVALVAFALVTSLTHARFLFFAGLIMAPILAPRLTLFPPYDRDSDKPLLNAAIMVGVVVALIHFFPSSERLQQKVDAEYPTAALNFMQAQNITGRILNSYGWGGYMEWRAPELRPFIDGRADIFIYNGVFADYVDATTLRRLLEVLDKYHIAYALLGPEKPMAYLLDHVPGWRVIYSDKVAKLYERQSIEGAAGPGGK